MTRERSGGKRRSGVTYERVRELAHELPGVEDGTSYGTSALKVRGKLFVRLKEDGETIVLRTDAYERDFLIESDPQTFFITDHYRDYPWVLVRLPAIARGQLRELLEDAWRRVAPRRLLGERDNEGRAARRSDHGPRSG